MNPGSTEEQVAFDVCVVGLGYVGLPTAILMANAGLRVLGVDLDEAKLHRLRAGDAAMPGEGLDDMLAAVVADARLQLSDRPARAGAHLICVPTPVTADHRADLTMVWGAFAAVVPLLDADSVVVIESTVPPRTVATARAQLEAARPELAGGVHLAHCPERVLPGAVKHEIVHNARIVGGETPEATQRVAELYRTFAQGPLVCTDAVTAELSKLAENTFRDVSIALSNEIMVVAETLGANGAQVLEIASEHPRVTFLQPGLGVGGHCIPVDPWFLVEAAPALTGLVAAARHRNDAMPAYWLQRCIDVLGPSAAGARIAVLGLSYKGDVLDFRESPSIELIHLARAAGLEVVACDPLADDAAVASLGQALGLPVTTSVLEACTDADLVVIASGHTEFAKLDPTRIASVVRRALVVDARGVLSRAAWAAAGFDVSGLARA